MEVLDHQPLAGGAEHPGDPRQVGRRLADRLRLGLPLAAGFAACSEVQLGFADDDVPELAAAREVELALDLARPTRRISARTSSAPSASRTTDSGLLSTWHCTAIVSSTSSWLARSHKRGLARSRAQMPGPAARSTTAKTETVALAANSADGETRTRTGETTIFRRAVLALESRAKSCKARLRHFRERSPGLAIPSVSQRFGRWRSCHLPMDGVSPDVRATG